MDGLVSTLLGLRISSKLVEGERVSGGRELFFNVSLCVKGTYVEHKWWDRVFNF